MEMLLLEKKDGIQYITINRPEKLNALNKTTLSELKQTFQSVYDDNEVAAVVLKGAGEKAFVAGADITEFLEWFGKDEDGIIRDIFAANEIFNAFEDLQIPTVVAINGLALGGGFEMCLAADYRVMSTKAKVGLPEVKLGIYPGFGGTVRLSRIIGADNAIEWIASGNEKRADAAVADGAVDVISEPDALHDTALALLERLISGEVEYKNRRAAKQGKLQLNNIESMMVFETAKGFIAGKAGRHYPAPVEAVKTIQKHANFDRDKALAIETKGFAKMAKTAVAKNLIGLFLNDQKIKKIAKDHIKLSREVARAGVLGAGIMGGGIAYQSASKGTPILMKDIAESGLQLGLDEAAKLLSKQVERNKLDVRGLADTLNRIRPTLSYGDFGDVDVVVEAVVENIKVKKSVLAEAEGHLRDDAVLASNTSTISITELATALKKPEQFCGMHFFNPVHRMPLVEVIRGEKTSDETIATVVAFAQKMGKTPIVVNDCPGFLVNRILFPYFGGFAMLLRDGADFEQVDKVMETFGWPMGPAYLMDVVGIDTGVHAQAVLADGFPERMQQDFKSAMDVMYAEERYGQKNGVGFYRYETDKKGKPKKVSDEKAHELVGSVRSTQSEISDDDIVNRLMIPMCLETVRCLEDGIVDTAAEADMGLVYGIGFPPFRGGALQYIDDIGVAAFVALCDQYKDLGKLYEPTEKLRDMAKNSQTFYG
jgi:3-hydroxyacyl-CoA dehydrogenase/enoyl-CoA hydratase/3-hydroxybutyryl-CoA epimerase/enoyl-CoA isomerase